VQFPIEAAFHKRFNILFNGIEWRSSDLKGTDEPPKTTLGILLRIGPGLIIAGQIVGSGELIATTKTGAEAGFWLLWLILVGCVIKVFTQVELGRYTIIAGRTTMAALNEVPGPRIRVSWILWYWIFMFLASLAQLGGIVGGVGQALAITQPLTREGVRFNDYQDTMTRNEVLRALLERVDRRIIEAADDTTVRSLQERRSELREELAAQPAVPDTAPDSRDDIIWAAIVTAITSVALIAGRYRLVQTLAAALVALFTVITVGNLIHLQTLSDWRVGLSEILDGLSFQLPDYEGSLANSPLATALATFGIIGVGATELIAYPYWCLEKGYARWTGLRETTEEWERRARGWLRVMHWDAWISCIIYTFATVVFYLLGAAVLGRTGLNPEGTRMVRTLSEMYAPVFGVLAQAVFLFGAIAVLYSTFFLATAGHARVTADALRIFRLSGSSTRTRVFWTKVFCGLFPFVCFFVYAYVRAPVALVLTSGVMQAIMLPMLAGAALYFRYRCSDNRLKPTFLWDIMLWISAFGCLLAGGWLALAKILPQLQ
jgi:Mn2+/Fe2+ NRAMP family transporter